MARSRTGSVLLLIVGALLALPPVAAAEPAGEPFKFATEATEDPDIASATAGRALTMWSTAAQPAFRLLSSTAPVGDRAQATPAGSSSPWGDRIAANPRLGQYLHVWASATSDPYEITLYSQRSDAAGAAIGTPNVLYRTTAFVGVRVFDVAYNPRTRQYILAWSITDDAPVSISTSLLDESGRTVSDLHYPASGGNVASASVVVRPRGGYLVAWSEPDWLTEGVPVVIRSQAATDAGASGPVRTVSAHRNLVGLAENAEPSIAMDPETNEGIVVWTDQYEIFGRRIDASGAPTGQDLWLSRMGPPTDPAWLTRSPDIAYSPAAKQFLVVWQSGPNRDPYPAGEVVYGQHLDRAGAQIGANDFAIATRDRAVEPTVAALAGGSDFLVAWSSHLDGRSAWARRITPTVAGRPPVLPEDDPTPDAPPLSPSGPSGPAFTGPGASGTTGPVVTPPGAPTPVPAPSAAAPPASARPALAARVIAGTRLRELARSGLRVSVRCASACRATATLTISRAAARRLGTGRTLARTAIAVRAGRSATVRLRPPAAVRRRLLRLTRLQATLAVDAREPGGARHALRRTVRLVR